MKRRTSFCVLAAALLAASASARSVYITLWRGETATKILHDYARIGKAPDGFVHGRQSGARIFAHSLDVDVESARRNHDHILLMRCSNMKTAINGGKAALISLAAMFASR